MHNTDLCCCFFFRLCDTIAAIICVSAALLTENSQACGTQGYAALIDCVRVLHGLLLLVPLPRIDITSCRGVLAQKLCKLHKARRDLIHSCSHVFSEPVSLTISTFVKKGLLKKINK